MSGRDEGMYSNLKNVQILLAGLKAYGICHVVISPGNSHNAIVRSMEEDDWFITYSIVDERSAAFFACGICQELQEPVAICCTAGTAASNYLTGVTEAARRGLPLVVITGDKNPYYLGQGEDQMIDAIGVFASVIRRAVLLPICHDADDEWVCARRTNEALLELNHHGIGPVQIDVPIESGMLAIGNSFSASMLPTFPKVDRLDQLSSSAQWEQRFRSLSGKRVLILYGQDFQGSGAEELLDAIAEKYDVAVSVDKLSNVHAECCVETQAASLMGNAAASLAPDVVIVLSGNTATQYKFNLKRAVSESWVVLPEGELRDEYRNLTCIFECGHLEFLRRMASASVSPTKGGYLDEWRRILTRVPRPDFAWSNLYAISRLMPAIPPGSLLHLANSSTIRIAQYFKLDPSVAVYCNRGVNGIDGCMSTFVGQSSVHEGPCFLIIGDLAFFYDMNALWNRYVGNNVRILLLNNGGASLFHFNQGLKAYPTLDENVAAKHTANAGGWVESLGIKYKRAETIEGFNTSLAEFVDSSLDGPMVLECITSAADDAREQHSYYDRFVTPTERRISAAKSAIKKVVGR